MIPTASATQLLGYTQTLLAQMSALATEHDAATDGAFSDFVGPHLRHILEHYEALSTQLAFADDTANPPVVDYDARARDLRVQTDPAYAVQRIALLAATLAPMAQWTDAHYARPLRMRAQAGVQGEFYVEVASNWLRELMFLASHSVHHFAVVKLQAQQRGKDLGEHFGKAPATVSHAFRAPLQ